MLKRRGRGGRCLRVRHYLFSFRFGSRIGFFWWARNPSEHLFAGNRYFTFEASFLSGSRSTSDSLACDSNSPLTPGDTSPSQEKACLGFPKVEKNDDLGRGAEGSEGPGLPFSAGHVTVHRYSDPTKSGTAFVRGAAESIAKRQFQKDTESLGRQEVCALSLALIKTTTDLTIAN